MSDIDSPDTFDKDYVQSLRAEAGKYRQQVKELRGDLQKYQGLEAQVQQIRVENELVRRGVEADPAWVSFDEGQSPSEAVENFLEKYPQFQNGVAVQEQEEVDLPEVPKAMSPKQKTNTNVPGPPAKGATGHRDLDTIKKDPVARQNLREHYRAMLSSGSHQVDNQY